MSNYPSKIEVISNMMHQSVRDFYTENGPVPRTEIAHGKFVINDVYGDHSLPVSPADFEQGAREWAANIDASSDLESRRTAAFINADLWGEINSSESFVSAVVDRIERNLLDDLNSPTAASDLSSEDYSVDTSLLTVLGVGAESIEFSQAPEIQIEEHQVTPVKEQDNSQVM